MYQVNENTIEFWWFTDQIFDSVSRQSMYYARNKRDGKGDDLTDEIGISADEKEFVLGELSSVMTDLFSFFIKVTRPIDNSLYVNDTMADGEKVLKCGFTVVKHPDKDGGVWFNANRLRSISDKGLDYIVCSILIRWAKLNGLQDEVINRTNDQTTTIRSLKEHLFYLKVPTYGNSYNIVS